MITSFQDLDLSGVTSDAGPRYLDVGIHNVKVKSAEFKSCQNPKNKRIEVHFEDEQGLTRRHDFNVVNASAKAQEIGLSQFKRLLECGGHPSPDKPGDISSVVGLEVQVDIKLGRKNDEGNQYPEVKKIMVSGQEKETKKPELEDEIPF